MRVADVAQRRAFHIGKQEFLNGPNAFVFPHAGLPRWRGLSANSQRDSSRCESFYSVLKSVIAPKDFLGGAWQRNSGSIRTLENLSIRSLNSATSQRGWAERSS